MKKLKLKKCLFASVLTATTAAAIAIPLCSIKTVSPVQNKKTDDPGTNAIKTATIEYRETTNVTISGPKLVKGRVGKPFSSAEQPRPIHSRNWKFLGWSTQEGKEESIIHSSQAIPANGWVLYPVFETPALLSNCLCISAIESGTITINFQATPAANADDIDVWYSTDFGTTWTQIKSAKGTTKMLPITANENIYLRGNNPGGLSTSASNYTHISFSNKVNLFGNAMGLVDDGTTESQKYKTVPCAYCFYHLFANDTTDDKIQYVADNFFPCEGNPDASIAEQALTLKAHCYEGAFMNCAGMYHCPRLFATNNAVLGSSTNSTANCYKDIFNGCSNVNFIRTRYDGLCSAASSQFESWVSGVASSGTFVYNGSDTAANFGFTGTWTAELTPQDGHNEDVKINDSVVTDCIADHKYKFTATCKRGDKTEGVNQDVYWISTDETVATIDHITGILVGMPVQETKTVDIRCFSKGNLNADATKTVTVNPIDLGKCTQITGSTTETTKFYIEYVGEAPAAGIPNFKYSDDGGLTWLEIVLDQEITIEPADPAKTIYIKGDNPNGLSNGTSDSHARFVTTQGEFSLGGSIKGLIDDGLNSETIPCDYCFNSLFSESNVVSINSGYLPYLTLTEGCYSQMFDGCTKLTSLPTGLLPAGVSSGQIAKWCYNSMFYDCANLTTIPKDLLQATNLYEGCYDAMFYQCYKLENTCALPALVAQPYCYAYMFQQCQALKSIELISLTSLATESCFQTFALVTWKNISISTSSSGGTKMFKCPTTSGLYKPVEYMFYGNSGLYSPTANNTYYWHTK